jgi:hypothetical protein
MQLERSAPVHGILVPVGEPLARPDSSGDILHASCWGGAGVLGTTPEPRGVPFG